ncbi:hypothetical protein IMG5_089810, partial [Ichthyophthirius multifiliis]
MSGETTFITQEKYQTLEQKFKDSQVEIKQMSQLFERYRQETEQMEKVQLQQVEMLEQQLEKSSLEKEYLMLTLKKELQLITLETQKIINEKNDETQQLRTELEKKAQLLKSIIQDESSQDNQNQEIQNKENLNEEDKDKIIQNLKKQLLSKNVNIQELVQDIQKNEKLINEQKSMFEKFQKEILGKSQERDSKIILMQEKQIESLKKSIYAKDEYIKSLEEIPNCQNEEVELMRELISQQQEKLVKITNNFEMYRKESETLFAEQINLRDLQIKNLQMKLDIYQKYDDEFAQEEKEAQEEKDA